MMLSANFTLEEMLVSDTAARMGREVVPDRGILPNLRWGCENVMQPIRDLWGQPIIVSSGYRPQWLNKAIGGSPNSQHMDGCACDFKIVAGQGSLIQLMRDIVCTDIPFDQIIYETGVWIHVSWTPTGTPRGEVLTMYRKPRIMPLKPKSVYVTGIHEISTLLEQGVPA